MLLSQKSAMLQQATPLQLQRKAAWNKRTSSNASSTVKKLQAATMDKSTVATTDWAKLAEQMDKASPLEIMDHVRMAVQARKSKLARRCRLPPQAFVGSSNIPSRVVC